VILVLPSFAARLLLLEPAGGGLGCGEDGGIVVVVVVAGSSVAAAAAAPHPGPLLLHLGVRAKRSREHRVLQAGGVSLGEEEARARRKGLLSLLDALSEIVDFPPLSQGLSLLRQKKLAQNQRQSIKRREADQPSRANVPLALLPGGRPPRGALQGTRRRRREDQRTPGWRERRRQRSSRGSRIVVDASRQHCRSFSDLDLGFLSSFDPKAAPPRPRLLPLRPPRQQAYQRAASRLRLRRGGGKALRCEGAKRERGAVGGGAGRLGGEGRGGRGRAEGGDGEDEEP